MKKDLSVNVSVPGLDESRNKLAEYNKELEECKGAMTEMKLAGEDASEAYRQLEERAAELTDAMGDVSAEIRRAADDTRGMNDALDVMKSGVSAFSLLQSATAALGIEDSKLVETMTKLQAAQTALNSIQGIQQALMDKSSGTYKAFTKIMSMLTVETEANTVATEAGTVATVGMSNAMKILKVAIASTGVGLLAVAVGELVSVVQEWLSASEKEKERLEELKNLREENVKLIEDTNNAYVAYLEATGDLQDKELARLIKLQAAEDKLKAATEARDAAMLASQVATAWGAEATTIELQNEAQKQEKIMYEQMAIIAKLNAVQNDNKKSTSKAINDNTRAIERANQVTEEFNAKQIEDINKQFEAYKKLCEQIKLEGDYIDLNKMKLEEEEEQAEETYELSIQELRKLNEEYGKLPEAEKERLEEAEERARRIVDVISTSLDATKDLSSMIFSAVSDSVSSELDTVKDALKEIDSAVSKSEKKIEKHQKRIQNIYEELETATGDRAMQLRSELALQTQALEQEYNTEAEVEAKREELKRQQDQLEKRRQKTELTNKMIQSIIDTALSVTGAIAASPLTGGLPFSAINLALGAVQTGIIASQLAKHQMANGGLLVGPSHSNGGIPVGNTGIEVEGGEYVVNKRSTSQYFPLLEAINGKGSSGRSYANGGELNLPATNQDMLNMASTIDLNPVVSVTDIIRATNRLNRVKVLSR